MKITFLGACGNVTGSRFLVESEQGNILVDCGLYQEREYLERNWQPLPFPAEQIQNVILTHAHLDHCGYLPCLVKAGFQGKIFCTPATSEIARIVLLDAARVQEEDALFKQKRHRKEGRTGPYLEVPLFTEEEALSVLPLLQPVPYHQVFHPVSKMDVFFYNAGHILGAASLKIRYHHNGQVKNLVLSGDIGRWEQPLLCGPEVPEEADIVIVESTYGDRLHDPWQASIDKLERIIKETVSLGGKVVIPSFAVERAQEIIYQLNRLFHAGSLPPLPVYVDSPMAIDITAVFEKFPELLCGALRDGFQKNHDFFCFPFLHLTRTVAESKAINEIPGSAIIIAGSGMCTGGRIKHHLVHTISQPENTILFVGYQARGTLGREILEKATQVRIHGQYHQVKARIEKINGFSAHADQKDLYCWISTFLQKAEKIFLVHGEETASNSLAGVLGNPDRVTVPAYLDTYNF